MLLVANLIVTATRAGLLNIRPSRLASPRDQGDEKAKRTFDLVTHRATLRSTLKLIQTILRVLIGGLALTLYPTLAGRAVTAASTLLLLFGSAVVIWLLEFWVERYILRNPMPWALRLTPFANLLVKVFSPMLFLPMRLTKTDTATNLVTITEDELIALVDASQQAGEIEKDESEMIRSVFRFDEITAREIMVPRVDITYLEVNTPLAEAAEVLLETGFSRVPVYEGSTDHVLGLLYTKDMLKVWNSGNGDVTSLEPLLRPAYYIPEAKKVDELLDEMQAQRIHIAIVVDEYGGIAGLVTLEDIVEEIFGEIEDEYDEEEEDHYQEISPDEYIFLGHIPIEEINAVMNINLATDEADTLGGLIYTHLRRVPLKGEQMQIGPLMIEIIELNERRIQKVRASRQSAQQTNTEEADHA